MSDSVVTPVETEQEAVKAEVKRAVLDDELKSMAAVLKIVTALDPAAGLRVLGWVSSKLCERTRYVGLQPGDVIRRGGPASPPRPSSVSDYFDPSGDCRL
jgi:hypothetical protein